MSAALPTAIRTREPCGHREQKNVFAEPRCRWRGRDFCAEISISPRYLRILRLAGFSSFEKISMKAALDVLLRTASEQVLSLCVSCTNISSTKNLESPPESAQALQTLAQVTGSAP